MAGFGRKLAPRFGRFANLEVCIAASAALARTYLIGWDQPHLPRRPRLRTHRPETPRPRREDRARGGIEGIQKSLMAIYAHQRARRCRRITKQIRQPANVNARVAGSGRVSSRLNAVFSNLNPPVGALTVSVYWPGSSVPPTENE